MTKITALFALVFLFMGTFLHAQEVIQERNPPVITPAQYFQTQLERLYKSIDAKNDVQIARYEANLMAALRDNTALVQEAADSAPAKSFEPKMQEIMQKMAGFSFIGASKDQTNAHLELLETFLAILLL